VISWELLSSFDMSKLEADIRKIKRSNHSMKITHDLLPKHFPPSDIFTEPSSNELQFREDFLAKINPFRGFPITFVEGILILNDPAVANLCDLKYFIKLDQQTCIARRQTRHYEGWAEEDGYFDQVVWPWYGKNLDELTAKNQTDNISYLNGKDLIAKNVSDILYELMILCINRK